MKFRTYLAIWITLVAGAVAVAGPPGKAPATKPAASQPAASRPSAEEQRRERVREYTRRTVELLQRKRYTQAETLLIDAIALEPGNTTNLYNMACAKARLGKVDEAITYLETAASCGFTDFVHIEQDPDLAALRGTARYANLIANKGVYQKKEADRALGTLREQFGDKYLFDIDADAKLIYAANTDAQTLADVKKWLGMQAKSLWGELFAHKPDQYVAIVLPSTGDFEQIMRRIMRQRGVEGIYMHQARMLIAKRLGQVMTHEFTHALHAGDLDPLGQEHPIWIAEGLASLFEAGQFEGEKLVPRDNYRLVYLQMAYKEKTLIPLEKLVGWKQSQFVADANRAYGQASSVMLYLRELGLLRKFYETYKANYAKDPTGLASLEQATGQKVKEFDKAWQAWMIKRTPPAMETGPGGAFLGVYFAQENDGLKVDRVVMDGPADSAGMKAGDVIVGLNEMDVRDQKSLMPILKEFKPGERVVFRVRREERYMAVPITLGKRADKAMPVVPPGGKK